MISALHRILIHWWWLIRFKTESNKTSEKYIPENSTDKIIYLEQINCEYAFEAEGIGYIEPQTGWFLKGRTIVAESYPYWTNVPFGWPPLPSVKGALNPFKHKTHVDTAVSFHYGWDNYYHFFIDTLPQIKYWQKHGNADAVWIIPEKMKNARFVQDYLALDNFLEDRKVRFQQPNEYIHVKKCVHFVKRSRFKSHELNEVLNNLRTKITFPKGEERVFLTRSGNRSLINRMEIENLASSLNFTVIDAQGLSLVDQIQLFSKTRFLVGIHGAGLTNMIFRQGDALSLLEIFPADKRPAHYWHLTLDFNFHYTSVVGEALEQNMCFKLDPNEFERALRRMLDVDPNEKL